MVEASKDCGGGGHRESDDPDNAVTNSDDPTRALSRDLHHEEDSPSTNRSTSVATDSSPVTPGRLVYVRRRFENNTNVQPKQPKTSVSSSTLSLGASSAAELTPQGSLSGRLDWEDRYHHLQMLLNKLDESDHKDLAQMLRSLPSVELSRHAVQLEKRSIQLSLEEEFNNLRNTHLLNCIVDQSTLHERDAACCSFKCAWEVLE